MYEDSVPWQQCASSDQLIGQNISVPKIQGLDIWATYNYDYDALHRVVEQEHRPWRRVWWPSVLSQHSTHVLFQWTRANPRRAPGNKLLSSQQHYRAELMDVRMWYQGALPVVREGARASSSSKDSWKQVTADSRQLLSFCSIGWQRFVHVFC